MLKFLLRSVVLGLLAFAAGTVSLVSVPRPAIADSDNDGGGDDHGGDDHGGGHDGEGHGGNDNGNGSGRSGGGDDDDQGGSPFSPGNANKTGLKNKKLKFRSLSAIVRQFKRSKKGRFLDATISRRNGIIYYKVTYIGKNGKVGRIYYRALEQSENRRQKKMNFNRNE